MLQEIKNARLYGGVGQLLIIFSLLTPFLKFILAFIFNLWNFSNNIYLKPFSLKSSFSLFVLGSILLVLAVREISVIVSKKKEFQRFITYYLIFFSLLLLSAISIVLFVIIGFGSALSEQPYMPISITNFFLLTILFFSVILFMLAFVFYRKASLVLYKMTEKSLFRKSGNLVVIGASLVILSAITFITLFSIPILSFLILLFAILIIIAGLFMKTMAFFYLNNHNLEVVKNNKVNS